MPSNGLATAVTGVASNDGAGGSGMFAGLSFVFFEIEEVDSSTSFLFLGIALLSSGDLAEA